MPPRPSARSVCSAISRSPRRSRNSIVEAAGTSARRPSRRARRRRRAQRRDRGVERRGSTRRRALSAAAPAAAAGSRAACVDLLALLAPRSRDRLEHLRQLGMPWRGSGGK
jgi:hypothetical protein